MAAYINAKPSRGAWRVITILGRGIAMGMVMLLMGLLGMSHLALAQDAASAADPEGEDVTINTEEALGDLARSPADEGEPLFGSFIGVVRVLGAATVGAQAGDVAGSFDAGALTGIQADDPEAYGIAELRLLDKITARMSTQDVAIDDTISLGSLQITPRKCLKNPPTEPPESAVFLSIYEVPPEKEPARVFQGWMFASSPALNAMEHPVFDVWLLDCKN